MERGRRSERGGGFEGEERERGIYGRGDEEEMAHQRGFYYTRERERERESENEVRIEEREREREK